MKIDYCYHSHTKRCGHAFGEDEEFVLAAIKMGIKRLGISDHVIFNNPKYNQPGIRGNSDQLEDYLNSCNYLKDKYKDQIEIHIGFEAEYSPIFEDYYRYLLSSGKIEYLILGQHCYYKDNDRWWWQFNNQDPEGGMDKGIELMIQGIKSGLFTYVAHPDIYFFVVNEMNPHVEELTRKLLKTCEECKVPIEINVLGAQRKDDLEAFGSYPCGAFWDIAKEYDVKIVIGIDAHQPSHYNEKALDKVKDFIEYHKLKVDYEYHIENK